ncbi:hypothetical protein SSCG_01690 [Streptomyces clavuligerus]|nr:hypothetical protein SSCG_01690 [Streptomyces clavuligerus]
MPGPSAGAGHFPFPRAPVPSPRPLPALSSSLLLPSSPPLFSASLPLLFLFLFARLPRPAAQAGIQRLK